MSAPWGPGIVLAGIAAFLLVMLLAAGIASAWDPDIEDLGTILSLQAFQNVAMATVAFLAIAWGATPVERVADRARALGLIRPAREGIKAPAIGYLVYIGIAIVLAAALQPEQEDVARDLGVDEGALGAVVAGFLIVIAAPVVEEIFFRGFVFGGLRSRMPMVLAALISGGIFGISHFTGSDSWPVVLQLTIFGAILCAVYERTGSLYPVIGMHLLNNAIAFTVLVST